MTFAANCGVVLLAGALCSLPHGLLVPTVVWSYSLVRCAHYHMDFWCQLWSSLTLWCVVLITTWTFGANCGVVLLAGALCSLPHGLLVPTVAEPYSLVRCAHYHMDFWCQLWRSLLAGALCSSPHVYFQMEIFPLSPRIIINRHIHEYLFLLLLPTPRINPLLMLFIFSIEAWIEEINLK